MNRKILSDCESDLQLFAEGATGVDGAGQGAETGVNDPDAGDQMAENEERVADAQENVNLDAEFEDLIKGKYKEQYNNRTAKTVQSRLKGVKEKADKYDNAVNLMQKLGERYQVDPEDINGLILALDNDNDYLEKKAFEAGLTVDQYKKQLNEKKEMDDLKQRMADIERQKAESEAQRRVMAEVEEVKKVYPNFDFQTEIANERFAKLLKSGLFDIRGAYEEIHKAEMLNNAIETTKKQVANSIASGQKRPAENGTQNQAASAAKVNVASLTNAQINEINRRVLNGERITF